MAVQKRLIWIVSGLVIFILSLIILLYLLLPQAHIVQQFMLTPVVP